MYPLELEDLLYIVPAGHQVLLVVSVRRLLVVRLQLIQQLLPHDQIDVGIVRVWTCSEPAQDPNPSFFSNVLNDI
jgi:hypothetical protein